MDAEQFRIGEGGLPPKEERDTLFAALREAIHHVGRERFLRSPILLPEPSIFLRDWTPTVLGVETIAKKLFQHAGLGRLSIVVSGDREELDESPDDPPLSLHSEGSVWLSAIEDDIVLFGADCRRLEDVAGFLAHEIGHLAELVYLQSGDVVSYREKPKRYIRPKQDFASECRAEAFATALGLGVLSANHARVTSQPSRLGILPPDEDRGGCLPQECTALLLTTQLVLRRTPKAELSRIRSFLREGPALFFAAGMRYATPRIEELQEALGLDGIES